MKGDLAWRETELSAAEAGDIGVRGMRADHYATRCGGPHGVAHCRGVASVESAGDVGGGHEVEQCFVLRRAGVPEAFAQVRVEIDGGVQAATSCGFFSSRRQPAWLRRPPIPARRPRTRRA